LGFIQNFDLNFPHPTGNAMDKLMISHLAQMEADREDETDEDYAMEAAAAALLMHIGAEESCLAHAQNCLPTRLL